MPSAVLNVSEGSQKRLATLRSSCWCVSVVIVVDVCGEKVVDVPPVQAGALRQETHVSGTALATLIEHAPLTRVDGIGETTHS